jgi:TRAP-type C4-dicarboxylate transport system permease small subunit
MKKKRLLQRALDFCVIDVLSCAMGLLVLLYGWLVVLPVCLNSSKIQHPGIKDDILVYAVIFGPIAFGLIILIAPLAQKRLTKNNQPSA